MSTSGFIGISPFESMCQKGEEKRRASLGFCVSVKKGRRLRPSHGRRLRPLPRAPWWFFTVAPLRSQAGFSLETPDPPGDSGPGQGGDSGPPRVLHVFHSQLPSPVEGWILPGISGHPGDSGPSKAGDSGPSCFDWPR